MFQWESWNSMEARTSDRVCMINVTYFLIRELEIAQNRFLLYFTYFWAPLRVITKMWCTMVSYIFMFTYLKCWDSLFERPSVVEGSIWPGVGPWWSPAQHSRTSCYCISPSRAPSVSAGWQKQWRETSNDVMA